MTGVIVVVVLIFVNILLINFRIEKINESIKTMKLNGTIETKGTMEIKVIRSDK